MSHIKTIEVIWGLLKLDFWMILMIIYKVLHDLHIVDSPLVSTWHTTPEIKFEIAKHNSLTHPIVNHSIFITIRFVKKDFELFLYIPNVNNLTYDFVKLWLTWKLKHLISIVYHICPEISHMLSFSFHYSPLSSGWNKSSKFEFFLFLTWHSNGQ